MAQSTQQSATYAAFTPTPTFKANFADVSLWMTQHATPEINAKFAECISTLFQGGKQRAGAAYGAGAADYSGSASSSQRKRGRPLGSTTTKKGGITTEQVLAFVNQHNPVSEDQIINGLLPGETLTRQKQLTTLLKEMRNNDTAGINWQNLQPSTIVAMRQRRPSTSTRTRRRKAA